MFDKLHAPLLPIVRHLLADTRLPCAGVVLDLACGYGDKLPLLAEGRGPGLRVVALDWDIAAVRVAAGASEGRRTKDERSTTNEQRPTTNDVRAGLDPLRLPTTSYQPTTNDQRRTGGSRPAPTTSYQLPTTNYQLPTMCLVGDALALPLRAGCCDGAVCIAAMGLFADQGQALRELRRVLRPGAAALVVTSAVRWTRVTPWPPGLLAELVAGYRVALRHTGPLGADKDNAGEFLDGFRAAGFGGVKARAFLLDGAPDPLASELPLLPWPALRRALAGYVRAETLGRCEGLVGAAEIEPRELVLAAWAT